MRIDVPLDIKFETGSAELLRKMLMYRHHTEPFDSETLDFLYAWALKIRALERSSMTSALAAFAFWLRPASSEQMKKAYEGCERYTGLGVCLQFVPSNIPALSAYSLAAALLSGNCAIVRLSDRLGAEARSFIDTLNETIEERPEWKSRIALIRYGHDKDITDWLSRLCDVRVIWGGDRAVCEIQKSPLREGVPDVVFPNRRSMAVYDAASVNDAGNIEDIVKNFYNDTYITDQNACSSPGIICWIGSSDETERAKDRFWRAVSAFLDGRYEVSEDMTVLKLEQAMVMAAKGLSGTVTIGAGDEKTDSRIIRVKAQKADPGLWDYTMPCGFFIEITAASAEQLTPLFVPVCQTISYFGINKDELKEAVKDCGNFMIVPAGRTLDFDLKWDGHDLISEMCARKPLEYYIEREGCTLYTRVQGKGPLLVLIHGVACDSGFYEDAARLLENDFTVITYDRRGYSRSFAETEREDKEYFGTVSEQAKDVISILDAAAGEGSKAVICGCSAGGLIAVETAVSFPERVSRLMAYETAYTEDAGEIESLEEWKNEMKASAAASPARAMLRFINVIGNADPESPERPPEMLSKNMANLERFLEAEIDSMLDYARDHKGTVPQVPCDLAAGSLDRGSLFYNMTKRAASYWNARFDELKGKHNIAQDRPHIFADWIINCNTEI